MKHLKSYENTKDEPTFDWEHFKTFVNTYDQEEDGSNKWHIILEDMLYGLGMSIDKKEFRHANGFKKFKQYLKDGVDWRIKKDTKKYNL